MESHSSAFIGLLPRRHAPSHQPTHGARIDASCNADHAQPDDPNDRVVPRPQTLLGDADDKKERLEALEQEVQDKITALGGRIDKPKHALRFVTNIQYKAVGGQQLTADCMFCRKSISSTGATRVVDHFKECGLVRQEGCLFEQLVHDCLVFCSNKRGLP